MLKNTTVMDCGTVPENVAVGVESETFYDAKDWEEEIKELEDKSETW